MKDSKITPAMAKLSLFWIAAIGLMMACGSLAFAPAPRIAVIQKRQWNTHGSPVLLKLASGDNDNEEKRNNKNVSDDGDMNTFASQRNRFFFISRLQSAIVAAGWTFLAIGFILNIFGYDYVVKDGRLTIDTMEAAQFQQEVIKASKQPNISK